MGRNAVSLRPGFSASVHPKTPVPGINKTCGRDKPSRMKAPVGCMKCTCERLKGLERGLKRGQFVGSFFLIIMGFKTTAADKEWKR